MDGPGDDATKRIEETVHATKAAHDAGKGIIAMKVLGEGKMANNPEMRKKSTAFVVNSGCIDVLIASFDEKEHVTEFINNVAAALQQKV